MNDVEDKGVAITLGVLAMAGAVLVGTQLRWVSSEKAMVERQLSTLADRSTAAKTAKKQAEDLLHQREEQIKRAGETEAKYAALLTDLLELSKTDLDAQQITQKWKIQGAGGATPAAATAPKPASPEAGARPEKAPAKAPAGR
jgi:F0F1-type ATP synthase membrane subunit b/b'